MKEVRSDVIVLGGGPAGMAGALEASKHDVKVLIVERATEIGGILNQCIHTGFGINYFGAELSGPEFSQILKNRISSSSNINILTDTMVS
ncbi:MAG: FAD-dependent oxidoreductase, partial [Candidatus Korarchaeota archaeon]